MLSAHIKTVAQGLINSQFLAVTLSLFRIVIGRVVRGDYSFRQAQGFALAYCPVVALEAVKKGMVLIRNTSSKFYHPAKIQIHISPMVL